MNKLYHYVFLVLIVYAPVTSYAFKVDTHIWIGQQVINDLEDDGKLSITLDGQTVQLDVREDIKNSILANKSAYLMGNLGPDAAPDVLAGQVIVHPGLKDTNGNDIGWQSNDWLEYLLKSSNDSSTGKAFTYGYLGHAASDVFAHTYTNQYSGNVFDLLDGETLVEQRHFILEGYIGAHTPPIKNHQGQPLGLPWQQITLDDNYATFVRDKLIFNDEVQDQYKKSPMGTHLAGIYSYRKGIDKLAENGVWHDIDVAVLEIVAAYFDINITSEEASQLVDTAQDVIDVLHGDIPDEVQRFTNRLFAEAVRFDERLFGHIVSTTQRVHDTEAKWVGKHQEWRRKVLEKESEWRNRQKCPPKWLDPVNYRICKEANRLIDKLNNALLKVVEKAENELLDAKNDLVQAAIDIHDESIKAATAVHNIHNALIDLAQVIGADVSPVQAVLRGWRSDVDIAMTEYVKATSQMMINTINDNAEPLDPVTEWFDCYFGQIMGIPSSISSCEFRDSVQTVIKSIENIILIIDEAASLGGRLGLPTASDLIRLKDKLVADLVQKLKDEVGEKLIDFLPDEVQELIALLKVKPIDDAVLNQYYSKPEAPNQPTGLIMIPDMAERVRAEMNMGLGQYFDPEKYAVAYNAVVLAKLALLDKYGFEQLANYAGSSDYQTYMPMVDNIVAQAFASLDGNHQWMPLPPPLPNALNSYATVDYTYSTDRSALGQAGGLGFVLWRDDMRDKIFRKIFIGPLSPGIDAPGTIGKERIVDSIYPYQPCAGNPFPDDIYDRTCTAISAVPVLYFYLLMDQEE